MYSSGNYYMNTLSFRFKFQKWVKKMQGINRPFVNVGRALTSFAIHLEDGDLFSINYLHKGGNKIWYVVPAEEGKKLEELANTLLPPEKTGCSLAIRHKKLMITPSMLAKHGIRFARVCVICLFDVCCA